MSKEPVLAHFPTSAFKERHNFTDGSPAVVFFRRIDGTCEGPYTAFWSDGTLKATGYFHNGKKHGIWVGYPNSYTTIMEEYRDGALVHTTKHVQPEVAP